MRFAIIALLIPFAAFATDKPPAVPSQVQGQEQSQAQQQAQEQSQSVDQANSQSVEFEDREQAPSVFAPAIASSAACYYGVSGGFSVPGLGASGGKGILDPACENRENIRLAYAMGLVPESDYLFCSTIGKDIPNCGKRPVPEPVKCDEKIERVFEACASK
jgi:hypothetical protein